MENTTKVITGKVRLSYANIFTPKAMEGSTDEKYSCCLLIDKNDKPTVNKINKAIEAAKAKGKSEKWNGKIPGGLKLPLRDGEERSDEHPEYDGMYFINANNKQKPGVLKVENGNKEEVLDPTEVYSGCYALVSISFYPFNSNGNKGIACSLNNILKVADGEPLGGVTVDAETDFGGIDVSEYASEEVGEDFLD